MQQNSINGLAPNNCLEQTPGERAVAFHATGLNCAQSVLCASDKYSNLDYKTSCAVASGFGGGLRCGEVCGAASGAVMVIGCYCEGLGYSKQQVSSVTADFMKSFKNRFGNVRCFDLKSNRIDCDTLIKEAADMVNTLLEKLEGNK